MDSGGLYGLNHLKEHPEISKRDLKLIRALMPSARTVLDVGAGRGGFVLEAIKNGLQAVALDINPRAVEVWRTQEVPGVLGDALASPFYTRAFDVVRAKELLEHTPSPLALVLSMKQLLRQGGLLIVHVPSPYSQLFPAGNFWDDYTHIRPLSRLGLRRLIEDAGMHLIRVEGYIAGRNAVERLLGLLTARFLPHTYRAVATH